MRILKDFTDKQIQELVNKVYSSAEMCRKLNICDNGGNSTRLRLFLERKQIDCSHWTGQSWSKGKTSLDDDRLRKAKDNSLIFTENSNASSHYVRSLLIKHNLKEYKCECGITNEWNGKSISLQMDHINGNRKDHRLENLRWLCPNCHSQTDTFCSRNNNKKSVSEDELREALLTSPNIRQALAKFDLENGGNYRRAKRILKKVLDESNQNS
jgi:hypothetical protein